MVINEKVYGLAIVFPDTNTHPYFDRIAFSCKKENYGFSFIFSIKKPLS